MADTAGVSDVVFGLFWLLGYQFSRRVVPIALDSTWDRPEERTGFVHAPLESWVHQERGRLVIAALTILAAYTEAGRPKQAIAQYGSFEDWSDLMRSALVWLGPSTPPCLTPPRLPMGKRR